MLLPWEKVHTSQGEALSRNQQEQLEVIQCAINID